MDPQRQTFDQVASELNAFFKRIGKIWLPYELAFLDLDQHMIGGEFLANAVPVLVEFCQSNPGYHIVSFKDGVFYNKLVEGAITYHLADGDADANLGFEFGSRLSDRDFFEVGYTKFATVLRVIKGSDDT
ncbi:MAG: hypothetical protein FJ146_13225 [Deltaproteobacteria bacterium]|nr:hypothetical protein [Deltaproteobacteria bacterium]